MKLTEIQQIRRIIPSQMLGSAIKYDGMPNHEPLLTEVWRAACQHLELADAALRVFPLLGAELPVGLLAVRELDLVRRTIETVASAPSAGDEPAAPSHRELGADELDALLAWCRSGAVEHAAAGILRRRLPGLLPDGVERDVLVGPLPSPEEPRGVLLLVARRGRRFDDSHAALFRALLEPFAAALENDRRVRTLSAVREAAQAERAALLSRFGRTELGDTIVGAGAGLRPVMERVGLVAGLDVPVLVLGETGSGKEVVARAIHARSRRAAGPFIRVNCGAIPPGLIDSELFGHERGSFTGALAERRGWFERANRGTLFLDEIGELPGEAQVRLLRVLQDHTLERVGGHRPIPVDVRIVAATHRDLQTLIAEGRFREDLWYRIAVFPIHLPALRERVEDIPALAYHFALRASTRFGTPPRLPGPEDLEQLASYAWPGNVRELIAVVERAVILGDGERLDVAKALGVPPSGAGGAAVAGSTSPASAVARSTSPGSAEPFLALDRAIARHIEAALARTHGKIEGPGGAAALLEINPHTLRARMRRLGVDWRRHRPA
jgi:transcriptional regulator with GAF, ATPase, and Fis domain